MSSIIYWCTLSATLSVFTVVNTIFIRHSGQTSSLYLSRSDINRRSGRHCADNGFVPYKNSDIAAHRILSSASALPQIRPKDTENLRRMASVPHYPPHPQLPATNNRIGLAARLVPSSADRCRAGGVVGVASEAASRRRRRGGRRVGHAGRCCSKPGVVAAGGGAR